MNLEQKLEIIQARTKYLENVIKDLSEVTEFLLRMVPHDLKNSSCSILGPLMINGKRTPNGELLKNNIYVTEIFEAHGVHNQKFIMSKKRSLPQYKIYINGQKLTNQRVKFNNRKLWVYPLRAGDKVQVTYFAKYEENSI